MNDITIPKAPKKRATRSDKGVAKAKREPRQEVEKKARRQRKPFGSLSMKMSVDQQTLDFLERKGMVPRWINDENHGQRLREAVAGGYEFISSTGSTTIGSDNIDSEHNIKKLVGSDKSGEAKYAYLMAIPKDFHEEDRQNKEAVNKQVDDSIRAGTPGGAQLGVADSLARVNANVTYKP